MTGLISLLNGTIASSLVQEEAPPVVYEKLFAMMGISPLRKDQSTYELRCGGQFWCDPSEKPPGFPGRSAHFGGDSQATFGLMTLTSADTGVFVGAEEFTIEFDIKMKTAPTALRVVMGNYYTASTYRRWWITFNSSLYRIELNVADASSPSTTRVAAFTIGSANWNAMTTSWLHIAAQRVGNEMSLSVNGVKGNVVYTWAAGGGGNASTTMATFFNGYAYSRSNFFGGWVDNLRMTKGKARYTTFPFTKPSAPHPVGIDNDPDWNYVTLFCDFDDTFGLLLSGTAGLRADDVVYTNKSANNDIFLVSRQGINSRNNINYYIPTNSAMNLGSSDFTFEIVFTRNSSDPYELLLPNSGTGPFSIVGASSTTRTISVKNSSNTVVLTHTYTPVLNAEQHVAITRDGNNLNLYINGSFITSEVITGDVYPFDTSGFLLGVTSTTASHTIRGIRITKGVLYTGSSFVVPTDIETWTDDAFE